jgi:hypothetical protein
MFHQEALGGVGGEEVKGKKVSTSPGRNTACDSYRMPGRHRNPIAFFPDIMVSVDIPGAQTAYGIEGSQCFLLFEKGRKRR